MEDFYVEEYNPEGKIMTVIGLGYIGLPAAAMFSSGFTVFGYDKSSDVRKSLREGNFFVEKDVWELLKEAKDSGRFNIIDEIRESDVFVICVPTPLTDEKKADLSMVREACENISKVIKKGDTVILESTSPPKTCTDFIAPIFLEKTGFHAGEDFYLAHSPERVTPGNIVEEFLNNSRVIGGYDERSAEVVSSIYQNFVNGEIFTTDSTTAEFSKVAENTYRDVNIALANEFAKISEELGVDVRELIKLSNLHKRVNILSPGPGVGGHCIAVDPWFLCGISDEAKLVRCAREVNDNMPRYTYEKITDILDKGKIVLLGLTFKPDVDDFRGSPIVELAKMLLENKNYTVELLDPYGAKKNMRIMENPIKDDVINAVQNADLVVLGVNHREYSSLGIKVIGQLMRTRRFLDTRGVYKWTDLVMAGFEAHFLGNGKHS